MNEITPRDLHVLAGLLVAVLAVLAVALKVGSKFLDDWFERYRTKGQSSDVNGNGETKRVCFMGEGAAEHLAAAIESTHDQLRDQIHANNAAVISILDRLASAAEKHVDTQRILATTLAMMGDRLDRIERRLDFHRMMPPEQGGG